MRNSLANSGHIITNQKNNKKEFQSIKFDNQEIPTFQELLSKIPGSGYTITDERLLFNTQVKNLNKTLAKKSPERKIKIWQQTLVKEEDRDISIRNKIFEIKQNVRERNTDLIDKQSKFINKISLTSIIESEKILAVRGKNSDNNTRSGSVSEFIQNNKEICLKNFISELLKDESEIIKRRQIDINQCLVDSSSKLDIDYRNFMSYIDSEKEIGKKNDEIFNKAVNLNKDLYENKKKLATDEKIVLEELDRIVKMVLVYKSYAMFLHLKVMANYDVAFKLDPSYLDFNDEENVKDIDTLASLEQILEEFKALERNEFVKPSFLNNTQEMENKFLELEDNVLKILDKTQLLEKENVKLSQERNTQLQELEDRLKKLTDEQQKDTIEKSKDEKQIQSFKKVVRGDGANQGVINLIQELSEVANQNHEDEDNNYNKNSRKKKNNYNIVKDILETLRVKEMTVITLINQMEHIQQYDEVTLKKQILYRKDKNKENKVKAKRLLEDEIEIQKKEKAEERIHKIVIKGRIVPKHDMINFTKKQLNTEVKYNQEDDDNNILNYGTENQ